MNKMTISSKVIAKTKQHVNAGSETFEGMDQASKAGLSMMTGVSVIIGTWALASLISALVGISGNPLQLIQNWFSAVTGM
jgi:hypothetical protein